MELNITTMRTSSDGAWQGDNPLHHAFPLLIVQTTLVLFVSRLLALLLKPLRQPKVIAEILVLFFYFFIFADICVLICLKLRFFLIFLLCMTEKNVCFYFLAYNSGWDFVGTISTWPEQTLLADHIPFMEHPHTRIRSKHWPSLLLISCWP